MSRTGMRSHSSSSKSSGSHGAKRNATESEVDPRTFGERRCKQRKRTEQSTDSID